MDSAQDQIMLSIVLCCGSMGSMICLAGRVRATLYLVTPIFRAILICLTKSGLMVFTGGDMKVVVDLRILRGIFKRLNAWGWFKVCAILLI